MAVHYMGIGSSINVVEHHFPLHIPSMHLVLMERPSVLLPALYTSR